MLIAALLSRKGAPAKVVARGLGGRIRVLVSGGRHLLELAAQMPVRTPREFLSMLDQ